MIKKIYLPLMLLMTLAFVGCNKDMKPLSADYFTVTPSPLEVVGGQVPATVTGTFPEKYFDKKSVVTVTPYLVYADGETAGTPFVYQGEKVEGNDQAISYKMGGVVSMPVNFKYIPAMRKSELQLAFKVQRGKKTYDLPRVTVAEGVISTAEIANAQELNPAITPDKFQRIIEEKYSAELDEALKQYAELKEQAAGMDAAELMDARLAVRDEKERSAVDRVKSAYGEKYDLMMMYDSKRHVANLLHEEAEARSIREHLLQKQQRQAQQKQNKKKSRDSWER